MLAEMRRAVPASASLGAVVNTHANGDHTFGNQLVEGARIIASQACAEDMKLRPPEELARWGREWPQMGLAGKFWQEFQELDEAEETEIVRFVSERVQCDSAKAKSIIVQSFKTAITISELVREGVQLARIIKAA